MSAEQAKQFVDQATQSLQSGQPAQALELIDQAIALNPDDSESHVLRAIALSQTNQPDAATEAFRKAISLGPNNPKAYFNLSVHYYALGQKAEALEMARETIRLDPGHAGAKDLVARVETESQAAPVQTPTPQPDAPAADGAQPAGEQPNLGPQTPYGNVPPPSGYVRPGYETQGIHSLQFVANMGKTWDTFAWIIVVAALCVFVVSMAIMMPVYMEMFRNPNAARGMSPFAMGATGAQWALSIVSWLLTLSSLVWMILELVDRRGNWLWLLPYIICCCCGFHWLILGIYLLVGRQK